jgi:uncharacterized protein
VSTVSCIYEGTIRHRRREPPRSFEHRLALLYLDLDELPHLFAGRLLARRPGVLRFRRRDYLGDPAVPLPDAVRARVLAATGSQPDGPIRLLTQVRSFGHCFNPVSFYYCFDSAGWRVQTIVAEVTNTPWRERQVYVLPGGKAEVGFDKALHVSPFMGMDHRYSARMSIPGECLAVHIESRLRSGEPAFDATLALRRRALTRRSAAAMTVRDPLAGVRVLALIYWHALGLKVAGAPVYRRPSEHAA